MFKETDFFDEKFYKIIDLISINIYWKNKEGHYLGCNQQVLNLYGLKSVNEVIGKSDAEILPISKNELAELLKNDQFALKHGIFEGEESGTFNGETITYLTKKISFLNEKGEIAGIMGISLDITNQKKLQELERKKIILEEQLKVTQIIDSVKASIYWKDQKGEKYLGCNRYMLDLFGVKTREEIVGMSEYDLLSKEEAQKITEIDQYVLTNGRFEGEESFTVPTGEEKTYYTIKHQLFDSEGNVIGLVGTSLDITTQKKAENLILENALHKTIEKEHQQFRTIVNQVVHDIVSPLSALRMIIPGLTTVPEKLRITLKQAVTQIEDIANDLLKHYKIRETPITTDVEPDTEPHMLFVSMELSAILSEKRIEFGALPVMFDHKIDPDAYFSFIQVNRKDWLRMLSNLINNAVDALEGRAGNVQIALHNTADNVVMIISDTGKGMSAVVRDKILQGISVTEGKPNGHGIGMTQVADTLRKNEGTLGIESSPSGTKMIINFARAAQPDWATTSLTLNADQLVLILDDDQFIHGAWEARFTPILENYPLMKLIHFTDGAKLLDFLATLTKSELHKVCLLSDYELLNQKMNGLDIIEQQKISRAILVTSHYANNRIIARAKKLNTFVLPKRLASKVSIEIIPLAE